MMQSVILNRKSKIENQKWYDCRVFGQFSVTGDRFFTSKKTGRVGSWIATENTTRQIIERSYKIPIPKLPRNHMISHSCVKYPIGGTSFVGRHESSYGGFQNRFLGSHTYTPIASLVSAPLWIVCGKWMGLLCTISFSPIRLPDRSPSFC